jgi:hypothetical protein
MNNELDYKKISELSAALASYAEELSANALKHNFTDVRITFGWMKTLFESIEWEVKP